MRSFFAWRMLIEALAQNDRNSLRIQRSRMRQRTNPVIDLPEAEFRRKYRLSKDSFVFLCEELRQLTDLKSSQRVTLELKVLTALLFYANGSYQRPIGRALHLSQKMCSVYIQEVTQALIHPNMLNKYISFPNTPAARQAVSQKFNTKYGLPGVIGCIDGSHFRIFVPNTAEEHLYFSRKHYNSLNVQMICDSDYRIININPKFGGATHNSFIWENSVVNPFMQALHRDGEMVWLLGDSGYAQRPWLMTPFLDPVQGSPEAYYNDKHMAARVTIENTFGRLKNRWRCLRKDRTLRYTPTKCAQIIQACCVLHNLALDFNVPEPTDYADKEIDDDDQEVEIQEKHVETTSSTSDLIRGRAVRDQLVRRLNFNAASAS